MIGRALLMVRKKGCLLNVSSIISLLSGEEKKTPGIAFLCTGAKDSRIWDFWAPPGPGGGFSGAVEVSLGVSEDSVETPRGSRGLF